MLAITRKNEIKRLISEKYTVVVSDLSKKFGITEETIRKDLKQLEDEGFLKRIYGGAVLEDAVQTEIDVSVREGILVEDKETIADECATLIHEHDSVFLDGSTTSYYIARKLISIPITVITNSLKVASVLAPQNDVALVMIGGRLDSRIQTLLGKTAVLGIQEYFVDKAFISSSSVHASHGITDSNEQRAEIHRLVISHAHKTVLAVDHTKFDKTSFSFVASLDQVDVFVTDRVVSDDWAKHLNAARVEVIQPSRET